MKIRLFKVIHWRRLHIRCISSPRRCIGLSTKITDIGISCLGSLQYRCLNRLVLLRCAASATLCIEQRSPALSLRLPPLLSLCQSFSLLSLFLHALLPCFIHSLVLPFLPFLLSFVLPSMSKLSQYYTLPPPTL